MPVYPLWTPMVRSDDDIFLKNFGKTHKFWSLGLELQISSLRVFDEVSISSWNFKQVSISKVTLSTTSLVVGIWTGVGVSNLKNSRTRIQKFWDRSGVRVWKSHSGHLCMQHLMDQVSPTCSEVGLRLYFHWGVSRAQYIYPSSLFNVGFWHNTSWSCQWASYCYLSLFQKPEKLLKFFKFKSN